VAYLPRPAALPELPARTRPRRREGPNQVIRP
jgi:hypothetical protein